MFRFKLEILIVSLLLASVTALVLNYSCLRTLEITPNDDWVAISTDDRSAGGKSRSRASKSDNCFLLDFETKAGKTNPFTKISIHPADREQFDLSWAEEFRISSRCKLENSQADNFFYFEVRTFEDGVSKPNNDLSLKYNEAVIQTSESLSTIKVTRDEFSIPGWWTSMFSVPSNCRQPSFNNTQQFEFTSIATGIKGKLEIEKIEVAGHWVSHQALSQSLLTVWMLSFFGVLLTRILELRKDLNAQQQKENDLLELNELLAIQSKELSDMVSADPLTGLLNRRGALDVVLEVSEDLKSNGTIFSLIMFDIDRFKKINDTRGHLAGDQILCDTATIVRNRARITDAVCRWGGEEFLIICPKTNVDEAAELAEALRVAIMQSELNYTASFGVCSAAGLEDFADVMESVDVAMYYAKDSGRNRVTTYLTKDDGKAEFKTVSADMFSSGPASVINSVDQTMDQLTAFESQPGH
jgi:diguanylate cyclase (GGDEF)-like protein